MSQDNNRLELERRNRVSSMNSRVQARIGSNTVSGRPSGANDVSDGRAGSNAAANRSAAANSGGRDAAGGGSEAGNARSASAEGKSGSGGGTTVKSVGGAGSGQSNGKGKEGGKQPSKKPRKPMTPGRRVLRILWWTFRLLVVPVLFVTALVAGLYAGYVYLGKGPEDDVWSIDTWRHMWDLVFSES